MTRIEEEEEDCGWVELAWMSTQIWCHTVMPPCHLRMLRDI